MVAKKEIKTLGIFLGLSILIGSCVDDPAPVFLLKAYVKTFATDRWAIVSDEQGRVLDYKHIVTDGTVEFNGFPTQKVIYTTFDKTSYGYMLTSTQAIPIGTTIALDTTVYPQNAYPPVLGNASFTLQDVSFNLPSQDPGYLQEPLEFGAGFWTSTVMRLVSPAYQGSTLSFGLPIQSDSADVLGIGYRDGLPVHQWFRNVSAGDALTTSFTGFLPSKVIPINKKVAYFHVIGMYGDYFNEGRGYSLSRWQHWYYSGSTDKNKIPMPGYIAGFSKYSVSAILNSFGCCGYTENIFFDRVGPIPASIVLPDYTYILKNPVFRDFSFSFSNDYTYQEAAFTIEGKRSSQSNILWTVFAPAGDRLVQLKIPDEILSKYPDFKSDQLKLYMLDLTKELDGESYGDIFFMPAIMRKHFQKLTYQFQYD